MCQPVRNMQDMSQVIRVAQQNREVMARTFFKMSVEDLKKKSHLIVRIIPENIAVGQVPVLDFVELCGSDLAANVALHSASRENERDRKFASNSFNSLSQALLASAFNQAFKKENHSLLTRVLFQSMLLPASMIVFCVNLSGEGVNLRHNITALKFSAKIREAIVKRCNKKERRERINFQNNMNHNISVIESELTILKGKLFTSHEMSLEMTQDQ